MWVHHRTPRAARSGSAKWPAGGVLTTMANRARWFCLHRSRGGWCTVCRAASHEASRGAMCPILGGHAPPAAFPSGGERIDTGASGARLAVATAQCAKAKIVPSGSAPRVPKMVQFRIYYTADKMRKGAAASCIDRPARGVDGVQVPDLCKAGLVHVVRDLVARHWLLSWPPSSRPPAGCGAAKCAGVRLLTRASHSAPKCEVRSHMHFWVFERMVVCTRSVRTASACT